MTLLSAVRFLRPFALAAIMSFALAIPGHAESVTALVTMVNPIFGVGVAVAQSLLKDPVGQILAYEYSVTGPLGDPKVEQLNAQSRAPSGAP